MGGFFRNFESDFGKQYTDKMCAPKVEFCSLVVAFVILSSCFVCGVELEEINERSSKAICTCDLQMSAGWQKLHLLNIFKREVSAWGSGSNACARIQGGCRILCQFLGGRYIKGRKLSSNCQGTKLGQRLCELYSRKSGYEEVKAPGRRVSLNYKLEGCGKKEKYLQAASIQGKLCCSSFAPFKSLPHVKFMVWNQTCDHSMGHTYDVSGNMSL